MTPKNGTGEPFTPTQPKIADRCPSCGSQSLFVGAGGWLTCSVIGCKEPGVTRALANATRAAELRNRHKHEKIIEQYYGFGWKYKTAFGELWCKETGQLQGIVNAARGDRSQR